MKFRTEIFPEQLAEKINYQTSVLMMGSCFTEHIGSWLRDLKFPVMVNPFGVLYNPVSILNSLTIIIEKRHFQTADLGFHTNRYFSFYHHTSFSHEDAGKCLAAINHQIDQANAFLKTARYVFISLGTARVYEYLKTGQIVSNCHKIPAREFNQRLLAWDECKQALEQIMESLHHYNPDIQVIFTVSPVRHWKDAAAGNQLSKSLLICGVHRIIENRSRGTYFPSYELFMDDLRDYRFYAPDLLHPAENGIQYIWEKFAEACIDRKALVVSKQVEEIRKAVQHRPFDMTSQPHQEFIRKYLDAAGKLEKQHPSIDLSPEKDALKKQLI